MFYLFIPLSFQTVPFSFCYKRLPSADLTSDHGDNLVGLVDLVDQVFHPTLVRTFAAQFMFRDFEFLFQQYMDGIDFEEVGWRTDMRMKKQNTVIEVWPYRLTKEAGEEGAQEAFSLLETSRSDGRERFVEWVRLK